MNNPRFHIENPQTGHKTPGEILSVMDGHALVMFDDGQLAYMPLSSYPWLYVEDTEHFRKWLTGK